MDKEDAGLFTYLYTMEYYSALKKKILSFCNNMNKPKWHCAKWNKPDRERQILYVLIYVFVWGGREGGKGVSN